MAVRAAKEGMQVVLADIEEPALTQVVEELARGGAEVLAVRTDVSKEADVQALARRAQETFGAVHLLCNNAGVGGPSMAAWEWDLSDWKWMIDVNLWSVIHGIRAFMPMMLAQDEECHIVNSASMVSLVATPNRAPYTVSKYGVLGLSESLFQELNQREAKVGVSVLCPSWVETRIKNSGGNRQPEHQDPSAAETFTPEEEEAWWAAINADPRFRLMSPAEAADLVFAAVRQGDLYIVTHPEDKEFVRDRFEAILNGRNPAVVVM